MAENIFTIGDAPTMRPTPAGAGGRRLAAGDAILGRYTVVRELGEGGMGVVYQCLDSVGGVEVAVKGLPPEVSRNEDEMDDIRVNYQIVRKLRHPNIAGVATLEKDAEAGDYYLVMDLAAGTTLKRWARRHPDAGLDAKLAILRQVAAALDYAHAEKVIHRDVKPENVMVDDDGRVKVLDFGLAAQIRSSQSRTSNTVTSKGGTPGYKSPEQWLGRPQQAPADVYSFGVMAYWLFSGHLPFDGDDPVVLGHAVLSAPVGPIAGLPAHMNAALVKALAKAPEDRFSSCGAFMDALEGKGDFSRVERVDRVEDGNGRARSPSGLQSVGSCVPRDRTGGPRSRATAKIIFTAALLAALAGGGYYGWTKYDEGVKAREAQHAEERARLEKANEERIARLKAEKEKVEAEKRKIEDEREKREKELAEERARFEKERNASAKPETATELTLAEQEARQKEVARLAELRVDIGIKCDDAKEKMGRLAAYRGEPDGFKAHIDNADANWKIVKAVERNPATVLEAEASLKSVTEAENAIAKELHWLSTNKAARDGAKAAEAEIARAIDPELKRFKADDYARVVFAAGDRLRKEGNAALSNGDFPAAKKKLEEAKAKLSEAAANAKKFCIDTHLNAAKKWLAASRWQQCVEECDTVLGWDVANAEAKRLKAEAESHLVPTAKVVATIDGREVSGAKLNDGTKIHTTPINWKLEDGKKYGPYNVSYEIDGKQYYGTFDAVTVDWRGSREFTIALKEYTGPKAEDTKTLLTADDAARTDIDTYYVVKPGDTLFLISKRTNFRQAEILAANPGLRSDRLRVGQKLKLPGTMNTKASMKDGMSFNGELRTKTFTLPGGVKMEMVYVAPGSFTMGSPRSEDGHYDDETQHRVTLTKGYWLGKYEVTQRQWESVMGENPSRFTGPDRPVENVSWDDCQRFIAKVDAEARRQFGGGTRLPTEAEWEYACRAGTIGPYGGNGNLDDMGWYDGNSGSETHPVGQKQANAWGFYDMHGNVCEWCSDWHGSYGGSATDPTGAASGGSRVLRGGGWNSDARDCRSAYRDGDYPGYRGYSYGFRLCCSAGPREGGAEQ